MAPDTRRPAVGVMTQASIPTHPRWRIVLKWVQRIFAPLALAFLCYFTWRSRDMFGSLIAQARGGYLMTSLLCWAALHLSVSPVASARLLKSCGATVLYRTAFRIHTRNLPARYLPGGIWHTVGRVSDLHHCGVSAPQLATFVFLENTIAPGVSLTVGGISVCYFHGLGGWGAAGALGALGGLALLIIAPLIANLKMLPKLNSVALTDYAITIGWTMVFWCLAGASFVCYLLAFPFARDVPVLEAGGGYLFSWGVGFISIFSPQGIGVSEAVMANILPGQLPFGNMVTLAAGFRIIVLGADALAWVLSLLLRKSRI